MSHNDSSRIYEILNAVKLLTTEVCKLKVEVLELKKKNATILIPTEICEMLMGRIPVDDDGDVVTIPAEKEQ